jgi:Zn-dependent M32 family carboxypeptidase
MRSRESANPRLSRLVVASGKFETFQTWLCNNLYRHGSKFAPNDLVKRATGGQ